MIELGDLGLVEGRKGLYCVCAGAAPPSNIVAASERAREAAEPSEALTMTDGTICWRHEFTPLHFSTPEQRERAGVTM